MKVKECFLVLSILILVASFIVMSSFHTDARERYPANEGSIYMEPDNEDDLTPSGFPIRTAIPGDELLFKLWAVNNHSESQRVMMELIFPEGWQVSVTGSVIVPSNERSQFLIVVTVPDDMKMDPNGDYSIRVNGVGNSTGDRASMVIIVRLEAKVDHAMEITGSHSKEGELTVYPGQRTYLDIMVRNQGDIIDDIDIRIMDHQTDWEVIFRENTDMIMVILPPSKTDSVFSTRVLVGVPESAGIGTIRSFIIRSTSDMAAQYGAGTPNDEITISFKVVPPSSITIHPLETLQETESGSYMFTKFKVVMSGMVESSFQPSVTVYSGSFRQSNWEITMDVTGGMNMVPGENRVVNLIIRSPASTSGRFELIMGGTSDNANILEGKMTVMVRSGSNITFSDLVVKEAKIGSDIEVDLEVMNNGDSSQQIVLNHQGIPACFITEMEPSSFVLHAGGSKTVSIVLYPKNEDIPLEFEFSINIKVPVSDEDEWLLITEIKIPVVVRELPNAKVSLIDLPDRPIEEGEVIEINVTVNNPSSVDMKNLSIEIFEITWSFSNIKITSEVFDLNHGDEIVMNFNWTARPSARKIRALIVSSEEVEETDVSDNDLSEPINVRPRSNIDPGNDINGVNTRVPAKTAVGVAVGGSVILTAIALLVNTDLIRYPLWSSIFPLYSKLKPEHLLSNRLRKRIYVYVQNNPGEHFRGILVNLNLTNGTLAHHLNTLERESLIRSQRDGLYRRFYPAGYQIDEDHVSFSNVQRRIMELIRSEPGLSQKEISKKLSISNSTVNYNIKVLKEKEAIEIIKKGKTTHIYSTLDT